MAARCSIFAIDRLVGFCHDRFSITMFESREWRARARKEYFLSVLGFGVLAWPFSGIPAILVMLLTSLVEDIFHWDWRGWNFVLVIAAQQTSWLLIIGYIGFDWFKREKAHEESERSRPVTLYHPADNGEAIIRDGFRDPEGVLACEEPFALSNVFEGKQLLAITLPGSLDISKYEVDFQIGKRWWCLPSEIINSHGSLRSYCKVTSLSTQR
jgi:hypothetical protein